MRELRDPTRLRRALIEKRDKEQSACHPENAYAIIQIHLQRKEFLKELSLSEFDKTPLESNLSIIDKINEEIKKIDRIIQEKAQTR